MNWDQIETKWAAMTRRVRADSAIERPDLAAKPTRILPRTEVRGDVKPGALAKPKSGVTDTALQKITHE